MEFNLKDVHFEYTKGTGPGGQHKNKVESACRATHIPTGLQAYADTRSQHQSKKKALKELQKRVRQQADDQKAAQKKSRRDHAIHNTETIRTYDFSRGIVKDHRTGKTASLKNILQKGRLDMLR